MLKKPRRLTSKMCDFQLRLCCFRLHLPRNLWKKQCSCACVFSNICMHRFVEKQSTSRQRIYCILTSLHQDGMMRRDLPLSTCSQRLLVIHEISLNHVPATWFLDTKRRLLCQTFHNMPQFSNQCWLRERGR